MGRDTNKVTVLERRLYTYADVDDLARLPAGTARRWLEGYSRGSRDYPPLLRERSDPSAEGFVSWGEFVEADLVGRYRRKKVPVQRLRPVIKRLRDELQTPYPLALERPLVFDRHLIRAAQDAEGLPKDLELIVEDLNSGQLIAAPIVDQFLESVEYENDVIARLYPAGKTSPVRIDPLRAFGQPTVRSVRTDRLQEAFMAGDGFEVLAEIYELPVEDIQAAIRYEAHRADSYRRAA